MSDVRHEAVHQKFWQMNRPSTIVFGVIEFSFSITLPDKNSQVIEIQMTHSKRQRFTQAQPAKYHDLQDHQLGQTADHLSGFKKKTALFDDQRICLELCFPILALSVFKNTAVKTPGRICLDDFILDPLLKHPAQNDVGFFRDTLGGLSFTNCRKNDLSCLRVIFFQITVKERGFDDVRLQHLQVVFPTFFLKPGVFFDYFFAVCAK